ncbi:hypothetical protein [Candidatus Halobonum tyrrellensis]|uniref:Uncharacterized protein n=1 Tax=Candidatus Halobonum tyrrellensis G22 TaxID=1324957 RepID=V4J3W4_9EURY|nr:hypothetical protein [Candidatus Halobonum tyrrellensis]ESP90067.1 hypothetical protein K933_00852 [Candidatus Halobonum tyrrellensis G22]
MGGTVGRFLAGTTAPAPQRELVDGSNASTENGADAQQSSWSDDANQHSTLDSIRASTRDGRSRSRKAIQK